MTQKPTDQRMASGKDDANISAVPFFNFRTSKATPPYHNASV